MKLAEKKLFIVAIAFLLASVAYIYQKRPTKLANDEIKGASLAQRQPASLDKSQEKPKEKPRAGTERADGKAKQPKVEQLKSKPDLSGKNFKQWFDKEAEDMDARRYTSTETIGRIAEQAKRLDEPMAKQLTRWALDKAQPANRKILSAYMLSQARGLSPQYLEAVAVAPVGDGEPAKPHTLEETEQMQEKALRIMAIDALASRARNDDQAKQRFERLISRIKDSNVRAYAQKKWQELVSS